MSNSRILNCSKLIENYYTCITKRIAGFTQRTGIKGDTVYFSVKIEGENLCGAKGILDELTDYKPWPDSERYVQCFKVINIEYCEPFNLNILRAYGGKYWGPKYLFRSQAIKENDAIQRLKKEFKANKRDTLYIWPNEEEYDDTNINDDEEIKSPIDEKLEIMGTFQTIKFKNETDSVWGLEPLVNEHFYEIFEHFNKNNTVLIPQNRLFITKGVKIDEYNINGIKSITDALLVSYDKDNLDTPIKINIIEYECYGENKVRTKQKFDYLNGAIIPQLIRFASTFSIVTDNRIREKTIQEWVEKIIDYINGDEELTLKKIEWMKDLHNNIKETQIDRMLDKELKRSFERNIKIILIIDELTMEQKETIKNVIASFKLSNVNGKNNSIDFSAYIIRLEQRIGILNKDASFALSFQE
ncbi:hypothetical protein [Clostridium beijerinckii]|uniref:Uncharacterized protein YuzB (UPF0349 family) n=1 Tax=Clostridium beijerinckii TaxID=1520 RepID=A0AAE5EXJ2_CLOBE|nr:hypothetical protein [Clostridium beijerinckii]ALB45692.1 hypothetical protein X276_10655 [Clostridium beijerinckii NRRL B-598]NSB14214.1 uncharacterized protein YuzB (UPF0349 family) [Clostridium beijerinckii]OOM24240.1 hypothetical protein CLOBE_39100 [Clostridium beijerinckii]